MPPEEYKLPIITVLAQMGGQGRARDVLDRVYEKVRPRLSDVDLETLESGSVRWEKGARWAVYYLKERDGLLIRPTWGVWELTEEGWAEARGKGAATP